MPTQSAGRLPLEIATGSDAPSLDDQVAVLAAHMTARETATLQTEIETLRTSLETATTERDALAAQVDTLTLERDNVTAEFATFRENLETASVQEALTVERRAALAEVAPSLLEGEEATVNARMERLVGMEAAAFDDYIATLAEVAGARPAAPFSEKTAESASLKARVATQTTDGKASSRIVLGLEA